MTRFVDELSLFPITQTPPAVKSPERFTEITPQGSNQFLLISLETRSNRKLHNFANKRVG